MTKEELKKYILLKPTKNDGSLDLLLIMADRKLRTWLQVPGFMSEFASNKEKIFAILNNLDEKPKCFCGSYLSFKTIQSGYSFTCPAHRHNNPLIKEKRKQTNLERYGSINVFQSSEIKTKVKQTNLERYGVEYPSQSLEILERKKQTNLERYGVEHNFQRNEIQEKIKQTNLERYGVENVFASQLIQDKIKQTNLERYGVENVYAGKLIQDKIKLVNLEKYGVENAIQFTQIQEKIKQTNLKKYGAENVFASQLIQDKIKQTNLERYGVENPGQSLEIKQKAKQTTHERFGVEYPIQSLTLRAKIKQTNLGRYGAENVYASKLIQDKIKLINLEKYGVEYVFQRADVKEKVKLSGRSNFIKTKLPIYLDRLKQLDIIPLFKPEEYINVRTKYKFKHETCSKEFMGNFDDGLIPSCPHCRIVGSSQIERKLANDLELIFPQLIRNDRELIKPKEIDIIIDNIGIEVNGVYWHQADVEKTSLLEKSNMSPIQLLHFWDFELYSKYDICLSIIKAKLNHFENKIFARKCDIKRVSNKEAELFFEMNHLQGNVKSSYYLGLYFNGELVQCISMGSSRFNKNVDLEIHRIATKLNTTIVGGINKLWKQVLADFPDKKIITYADKRISNGELYKRLGFTEQKDSSPNYFYVKGETRLARYQCQKHKLPKLLGDKFNPAMTEKENMILCGWIQIKDCGNKVFISYDT